MNAFKYKIMWVTKCLELDRAAEKMEYHVSMVDERLVEIARHNSSCYGVSK